MDPLRRRPTARGGEVRSLVADALYREVRGGFAERRAWGEYAAKHFDVFVNVSPSEGLPLSIMEACGCGIPVIATDVGGTHEIVSDGVNGFLLPSDCGPEDVAAAIKRFVFLGKAEGSP